MSCEIDKDCMNFLGFCVIRCLTSTNRSVYLGVLGSLAEFLGIAEAEMSFVGSEIGKFMSFN